MSQPDDAPHDPARAERVATLLDLVWRRQQGRMAADLKVDKSTISRVAAGKAAPGRKLLAALAAHPRVNPAWLYTGEGDPTAPAAPSAPHVVTLRIELVVRDGRADAVAPLPAVLDLPIPLPTPPPPAQRGGRG